MLTHENHAEHYVADRAPALRRAGSRALNWWAALLIVCGPATLLLALLLVAPFLAVAFALGLAGTTARYVIRRDWAALAHIGAGLGLIVGGYVVARGFHHGGMPTVGGMMGSARGKVDDPNSAATLISLVRAVVVAATYFVGLSVLAAGSAYALIRPYRTRFSRRTVLVACLVVGAGIGLLG